MNWRQESPFRAPAGPDPASPRILRTVVGETWTPRPTSSPTIRWYPHRAFSRASRNASSRTSRLTFGRPGRRRQHQPLPSSTEPATLRARSDQNARDQRTIEFGTPHPRRHRVLPFSYTRDQRTSGKSAPCFYIVSLRSLVGIIGAASLSEPKALGGAGPLSRRTAIAPTMAAAKQAKPPIASTYRG